MVNSERIPPRRVSAWQSAMRPILVGHLVRHQGVEPRLGARAGHFVLGERRQIDHSDMAAQALRLGADMLEVVRTPETPLVRRKDARGSEPIGAFPAVALAENRTHSLEFVVNRTGLRRPRIGTLLVRIMDDENVPVRFLVLLNDVTLAGIGTIAARIDGHHVDAGFAFDDPFRELPARAAGGGDAEAMTFVEPEVLRPPSGAHEWAAVGGVCNRPIDDVLDAAVGERRDAALCRLDMRQQAFQVAFEQALAEPIRDNRRQIAPARRTRRVRVSSPCAPHGDSTIGPTRAARRVRGRLFGGRLSIPAASS